MLEYPLTARCLDPSACPFLEGHFCDNDGCAVEDDTVCLARSVTEHKKNLKRLSCAVTLSRPTTLHHCRGASMATTVFGTPGAGQKQNDALQIPLVARLHFGGGPSIDGGYGAQTWERENQKTQVELLLSTSRHLKYSVWTLAWRWASHLTRARVERFLQDSRSRFHRQ